MVGDVYTDTLGERRREVGRIVWSILHDLYAPNVDYPDTINTGGCEGFAQDVERELTQVGYTARVVWQDEQPTHCWVVVEDTGLVYDSETPYGVPKPDLLPFFLRTEADDGP